MTRLAKTTTLITGAGSGIGRHLAFETGKRGGRLVLWDVDSMSLGTLKSELQATGIDAVCMTCDLTDRSGIEDSSRQVLSEIGPVESQMTRSSADRVRSTSSSVVIFSPTSARRTTR